MLGYSISELVDVSSDRIPDKICDLDPFLEILDTVL